MVKASAQDSGYKQLQTLRAMTPCHQGKEDAAQSSASGPVASVGAAMHAAPVVSATHARNDIQDFRCASQSKSTHAHPPMRVNAASPAHLATWL